ncbi:uncharacterized protein LOC123316341 [Coccinella septempunctata]|uniref:uncharacterized protein LOC123316341 n=1 Tax=Coccinella septempunctata TaxID=41139 RepID=UPI001D05C3BF|nr:uncharacterized protein LOC123316341 [Coccinella septempunctata]
MNPYESDFERIVDFPNMDVEGVVFEKVENRETVDDLMYVRSSAEFSEITRISAGLETVRTYSGRKGSRSYRNFTTERDSCEAYLSASENVVYFQKMNARIVFPELYECHVGRKSRKPASRFGSFSTRGESRYSNLIRAIKKKQECEFCVRNDECYCKDEKHVLLTALARGCAMSRELQKPRPLLFTDIDKLERSVGKTIANNKGGSITRKYKEEHSSSRNKNETNKHKVEKVKKTYEELDSHGQTAKNKGYDGKNVRAMDQNIRGQRKAQAGESTDKDHQIRDSLILPRSSIISKVEYTPLKATKLKFLFPENIIQNDAADEKGSPEEVAVSCVCDETETQKQDNFDEKTDDRTCNSKCFSIDKNEIIPILDKFIEEIERIKLKCRCKPRKVCFMQDSCTQTSEANGMFSELCVDCFPIELTDPNPFKFKQQDRKNDNKHIYRYLSFKRRQMELLEDSFVLQFDSHDEKCLREAFFRFSSQSCS